MVGGWFPRTRGGWARAAAAVVAWGVVLGMIAVVVAPAFKDIHSLGSHDWDQMESHRIFVKKSLLDYHQFPFWNPYGCGGTPAWAAIEAATTVVSPWLPLYLFAPLPIAVRVEIIGMALVSAAGTWLLAGRFTRSAALRAFCCAAFVVNGRWALQAAVGHTWHLYYAWTPWVLYFFDRAAAPVDRPGARARWRDVVLCGACIAMLVYGGGIYPLPQTVVVLGLWACGVAAVYRSPSPLGIVACAGAVSIGLSAPKLVPVVDMLRRFPRLIDSTETMDLHALVVVLTARDQTLTWGPAAVSPYGWHEWGCYVGWAAFLALLAGAAFARGPREVPLKWVGLLLVVMSFGAFSEYAPWPILHRFPVFESQHVPSRWLYPATLLLAVVFASMVERLLRAARRARPAFEVVLLAGAAWVAWDVASVAAVPFAEGFVAHEPTVRPETRAFRSEQHVPPDEFYDPAAYGLPSLAAVISNVDPIECMLFPGLSVFARGAGGVIRGLGAKGRGDPAYRGEAYTASGAGRAQLVSFSPNAMTIRVDGATPGDLVVLNQNWDDGWRANGVGAIAYHDCAAARIGSPRETFVFRYRPRYMGFSLAVFALTVTGIGAAFARRRRAAQAPPVSGPGSTSGLVG